jgi:hypothetical protein
LVLRLAVHAHHPFLAETGAQHPHLGLKGSISRASRGVKDVEESERLTGFGGGWRLA